MSNGHLTPEQVLRVAYGHILDGIDQHKLAALMGVNQGRINEACKAIEFTINHLRDIHDITQGKAEIIKHNGDDNGRT